MKAWQLVYKLSQMGLDKDVHLSEHSSSILCIPVHTIEEQDLTAFDSSLKHWMHKRHRLNNQIANKKAIVIKV